MGCFAPKNDGGVYQKEKKVKRKQSYQKESNSAESVDGDGPVKGGGYKKEKKAKRKQC